MKQVILIKNRRIDELTNMINAKLQEVPNSKLVMVVHGTGHIFFAFIQYEA